MNESRRRQQPDAHGRNKDSFVRVSRRVIRSDAFRDVSSNAVKLLLFLWERFKGRNNGRISFSVREAMAVLQCGTLKARAAFDDLEAHGFIVCERQSSFDTKTRLAREWRLTMEWSSGNPPTMDFLKWTQNRNTVFGSNTDSVPSEHRNLQIKSHDSAESASTVLEANTVSDSTVFHSNTPISTMYGRENRADLNLENQRQQAKTPIADIGRERANQLAELRRNHGLSQTALAKTLSISRSYLAAIEQGHRPLPQALYQRIIHELIDDPAVRKAMLSGGVRR